MDNILIKKIWKDMQFFEIQIAASSNFIQATQNCYVDDESINKIADKICDYMNCYNDESYLAFGSKTGNFTPAFSLKILPSDAMGHVKIEVDIEIDDNNNRAHRCCFYVNCELGQIERFGESLRSLITAEVDEVISLT